MVGSGCGKKKASINCHNSLRPRQDSNLRHRLRRPLWIVQTVLSVPWNDSEVDLSSSQSAAVLAVGLV